VRTKYLHLRRAVTTRAKAPETAPSSLPARYARADER
jgi:hypothetical protein